MGARLAGEALDFVQRARVAIVRRQYAEAIKICRLGLLGQPALLEGRLVLGMALIAQGRHDEVLQEMRVALETDPQSALGWLMKGEALVGKRDFGQAELALERARGLDPSNPKAVELLGKIHRARAAGFEGVPIESTGTKEYPAQVGVDAKWISSPSVSFGPNEDTGSSLEPTRDPGGPTQETQVPVGDSGSWRAPDAEELTSVDDGAGDGRWQSPGDRPVSAAPASPAKVIPPVTVLAPVKGPASTQAPPAATPPRTAGPEEHTVFGRAGDIAVASTELATAVRGPDRATLELAAADEPRRSFDGPSERLPSGAQTKLAPEGLRGPGPAATRRPNQPTVDEDAVWRESAPTAPAKPRDPSPAARRTSTVEVEQIESRGFALPDRDSDPSISLSAHEVVFVPSASGEQSALEQTPAPTAGPYHEEAPVEDPDDFGPSTDDAHLRARRARERASPQQAQQPAPPPARSRRPHLAPAPDAPRAPSSGGQGFAALGPSPRPVGLLSRALEALAPSSGSRNWLAFAVVVAGAFATAVVAGLLIREWRLRGRVASRHELAQKKLTAGNYPGYQAAELLYRQILAERDDRRTAAMRAKVLAQLSFEFGESPELAQRAVQALSAGTTSEEREARVYVALAKGELELAARQAAELVRDRPGPQARYLLGQAQLLLDKPEEAAAALRTAAAEDPQNPIVLHALGLAEAALRHNEAAFEAYGRALTANANHITTIIDRALLQLRQGLDRETAAGSLEGVVGKLVADASPGQLARAYVGLAEIEIGKGNVTAARSALSSAAARRRDHPLLLEELAKAYADAFELDPAEREARRALTVSGRLTPRLILAEVALRRSRPVQALTILEESASSRPEALVLRALAKLELGRNQEARADAELAMRLDPTLVSAAVALARVDIGEAKYEAALRRLEALETQGKSAEVAWVLGQVYLARHQPDRARTCFREALHRQPLLLQARLALARLLHDAGQLGEAREEVNRILATNGAYAPARRELAALALDLGDAIAARDEFDALIERDTDLDSLLGGARARLMLGDARGAMERVDRALGLHPNGAELEATNCLKARALLADHRANEAIQLLLKVVPAASRGEPLALLLEAYLDYGRSDWAERAIALAPVATRTGIELTLAKSRLALEEARQAAGKGLAEEALGRLRAGRSPVWLRAQAFALLGRAEFELGNARGAWKSLKSALELDPHNVRAQYALGLAALELKRQDEAIAAFEGAIASDARFADAQFYLGRARKESSDPRADDSLRAYLELEPRGALAEEARRLLRGEPVTPTSDRPRNRRRGP